ncbi:MAG: S8 family serine peptidase, partial [Candidatus Promineifilaceae bacterium]|nr:S8 family serine peptidase [Candidatus Promineifilaceae bacterium]
LQALAQEASLAYISAPSYAVELNLDAVAAQTEGFAALNGQAWRSAGYDGSGVKIAIIDSSFGGYKSLLGSDLPANITVQNFVDGENNNDIGSSTSVHGTACAEIAADIVPGASFYLIKISTDLDLAQAVNYAISQGVDVISTSIGWYNVTPGDGSGYFDSLVKQARDKGIIWFTAGGNDRENHWGGQFHDPDGDGFHNFSGAQEVNFYGPGNGGAFQIGPGTLISVFVRWDDWQVTNQDYVLYIGRWNGGTWEIVGSSDRPQNGFFGQRPTESVVGVTTGSSAPYGFFIYRKNSNRNVNLEIFSPKTDRLDKLVPDRSLPNMADAAHAVTLGALGSIQPYVLEEYSSLGPTNGPGGTASGGITKPDFAGYSDVSTESYGFRAFSGTSASAPHGAGAAALVLEAFPGYAAQDVENFLAQQAKDKGAPGKDNVYGFGRLFLGDPPGTPPVLPFNNHLPAVIK